MGLIIQDAPRTREDGASCQQRYSITEDSNTHDRFAVVLSAPGVGVIGHIPREFLVWYDTFCSTERCLLAKHLEVPCLYTCSRCAAVDRSRYRAIFFDQKRMRLTSSTKDRKKGCAYDPGALMIQGVLQNQTLRYYSEMWEAASYILARSLTADGSHAKDKEKGPAGLVGKSPRCNTMYNSRRLNLYIIRYQELIKKRGKSV